MMVEELQDAGIEGGDHEAPHVRSAGIDAEDGGPPGEQGLVEDVDMVVLHLLGRAEEDQPFEVGVERSGRRERAQIHVLELVVAIGGVLR